MVCFQKCWKIFKSDIMQFFKDFHRHAKLVKGISSSFITLIPKKDYPVTLLDYRPISLIGSMYKILTKVLANKMKKVLPRVVSSVQSAFLKGRNILDGVLIANEVVEWWKMSHKQGVILKLDFQKAYDSVNWEFLLHMLQNFGFGSRFVGWIKECVASARILVLVNGSPTNEFCPKKGLRQAIHCLLFSLLLWLRH